MPSSTVDSCPFVVMMQTWLTNRVFPKTPSCLPVGPGCVPTIWKSPSRAASGPGGQHVNKVSTRATLRIAVESIHGLPTDARNRLRDLAGGRLTTDDVILLHADTTRSQRRNKDEALERLRDLVRRAAIRPRIRRTRKPSRAMIERRLNEKNQHAQKKRDRRRPDWD